METVLLQDIFNGHLAYTWRGVPCLKNPFDLSLYQLIVARLRPDTILEIGTAHGGSALFLADLCDALDAGRVVTVDPASILRVLPSAVFAHWRITTVPLRWQEFELPADVGRLLLIDDGSHGYSDVLGVLRKFGQRAAYIVVEDAIVTALGEHGLLEAEAFNGGPERAVSEWLAGEGTSFEADTEIQDYWGTGNTFNIYLRPKGSGQ